MISKEQEKYERGVFLFLILCFCYGFIRHGLLYYFQKQISLTNLFLPVLPIIIGVIESIGYTKIKKEKIRFTTLSTGLLLGLLLPPEFPLIYSILASILYFVVCFLFEKKFPRIQYLNLYACFILLLTITFGIGYHNIVEQNGTYVFGTIDIFFGKGLGGYGTTNIFLNILCYFFLASSFYYKKELPIYALGTYSVCFFAYYFLKPSEFLLSDYFSASVFFSFLLFLPHNPSSPVSKNGKIFYGISAGVLSFLFIHMGKIVEGAYLSIAICNLCYVIWYLFYKIRQKKSKVSLYKKKQA